MPSIMSLRREVGPGGEATGLGSVGGFRSFTWEPPTSTARMLCPVME